MNYYPFHIGDYLSATRHLSWEEDAAYRRLLDTYYTTEKPLPADLRAVCRLVLAQTDAQREAVRVVLEEFFQPTEAGWVNGRADAEILAMREKQQKQRDKANKRWAKPSEESGTAPAMPRHDVQDAAASKTDADAMPPTPTPTPIREEKGARKRSPPFDAGAIDLPEWIDRELWGGWVQERRARGKPITARAAKEQVASLAEYRENGHSPERVIRHAIASGNQGLFPPPRITPANAPPPARAETATVTVPSNAADATAALLRADEEHRREMIRQRDERRAREQGQAA